MCRNIFSNILNWETIVCFIKIKRIKANKFNNKTINIQSCFLNFLGCGSSRVFDSDFISNS